MTRRSLSPATRQRILDAHGHKCALCKAENVPFEIDHWVPLIFGGKDDDGNLRPLCVPCHKEVTKVTIGQNAKAKRLNNDHSTDTAKYWWPKRPFPKRGFGIKGLRKKLTGEVVKV